jgi:hypothetical protein
MSRLWACAPFKKPPEQSIDIAAYLEVFHSFTRSELPFVLTYLPIRVVLTASISLLPQFSELPKALKELQVVRWDAVRELHCELQDELHSQRYGSGITSPRGIRAHLWTSAIRSFY